MFKKLGLLIFVLSVVGCQSVGIKTNSPTVEINSPISETKISIIKIMPSDSKLLNQNSVIEAKLQYYIKDYVPGEYKVIAQFDTEKQGTTSDGTFPLEDYPVVTAAEGVLDIKFPIKHVWLQKPSDKPFVLQFYLNKRTGERSSRVIATTDKIIYNVEK
ncbi:MAG TPA: hypothetical protein PK002_09845 [Cellvibrio sp.]|nr:hypothetical protein [Cellvibrio sp.]